MEMKLIELVNKYLNEEINDSNQMSNLKSLGLDSMSSIELLVNIEKEFNIQIPDTMLTPATFENFENLKNSILDVID